MIGRAHPGRARASAVRTTLSGRTRAGIVTAVLVGVLTMFGAPGPVAALDRGSDVSGRTDEPGLGPAAQDVPSIDQLVAWAESETEEDAERLRRGLRERVAEADPTEATLWIQLLTVVEGLDAGLVPTAVRAVGLAVDLQGRAGSELILEALPDEEADGEASLLAMAALLVDPDDPARAAEIRARLVDDHPAAPETPEARLLLARFYLGTDDRQEEAVRMLERLIVQNPEHPVAPEARRLYESSRGREAEPGAGAGTP